MARKANTDGTAKPRTPPSPEQQAINEAVRLRSRAHRMELTAGMLRRQAAEVEAGIACGDADDHPPAI